MDDDRQFAPATLRNPDFILDLLRDVLPTKGVINEVAGGSGGQVVHFARNFPVPVFQTSDSGPAPPSECCPWVKGTGVIMRAPIARGTRSYQFGRSPTYTVCRSRSAVQVR
jgi:Protein of unknown function (DUF938)